MLQVDEVVVAYGQVEVVKSVSISVPAGEVRSIIGPNGAGKTSLLCAISGRVPVRSGRVVFDGTDITRLRPHRRASLGLIASPQGREVFGNLTVKENLDLGAYRFRRDRARRARRQQFVTDVFPPVGRLLGRMGASLSGGEQQMVAIGRALMAEPRLLVLDEPSASLAPVIVNQIFEVLARLREQGMTILFAEQNVPRALGVADYLYVLAGGRLQRHGVNQDIAAGESLSIAYLGTDAPDVAVGTTTGDHDGP